MDRQPAAGVKILELIHEMTGPIHGPVTPIPTHEAAPTASVNGYDMLILAGFSVDPGVCGHFHASVIGSALPSPELSGSNPKLSSIVLRTL